MEQTIQHSGAWALAIIMIVVISWFFYRYVAPKSWHEWASAGVVQAFIIALYAEMYGFPLTIYLLSRFLGLDRYDLNASLWSTLLGMGETGMMISMILGYALVLLGIGIFFQGWRQVHRARQQNTLVTDGLYRFVRHPQYTGLFIALFGEGVVHWPTLFSVGLITCWPERKSARYWRNLAKPIAPTSNGCLCLFLDGSNGERLSAVPV